LKYPIADPEHVDERRAAMGLSALADYLESSKQMLEQFRKCKDNWPHRSIGGFDE
jgi:hypothetical protein